MPSRGTKFKTPGYTAWRDMIQRCKNPKLSNYHLYGGQGIKVCDKWLKFDNFLEDMGEKPSGMTLDRTNNDGNYEPGNCRWATPKEQSRNRRINKYIEWNGKRLVAIDWQQETGINNITISTRLKRGWPVEQALTMPPFKPGDRRWHKHRYDWL